MPVLRAPLALSLAWYTCPMLPLATGTSSNSSKSSSTLAPRACLITARVNFRECAGACSHKTGRLASMTASVTGLGVRAYIVAWVVQCKLQGWHLEARVMTIQGRDQQMHTLVCCMSAVSVVQVSWL